MVTFISFVLVGLYVLLSNVLQFITKLFLKFITRNCKHHKCTTRMQVESQYSLPVFKNVSFVQFCYCADKAERTIEVQFSCTTAGASEFRARGVCRSQQSEKLCTLMSEEGIFWMNIFSRSKIKDSGTTAVCLAQNYLSTDLCCLCKFSIFTESHDMQLYNCVKCVYTEYKIEIIYTYCALSSLVVMGKC